MNALWDAAGGAGIALAAIVVLLGVLGFMLRTWIRAFIGGSVTYDFSVKLEEQKDELKRLTEQLSAVQSAGNAALIEAQRAAAEMRVAAAAELWSEIVRIRKAAPTAVGFQDVLVEESLNEPITLKKLKELIQHATLDAALQNQAIERVRPFVGETLFLQFYIYRAVNARVEILLREGIEKGKIIPWYRDKGVHELLGYVLTETELEQLQRERVAQLHWMQNAVEAKILQGLQRLIAGEVSSEEGIRQAQKNLEAVRAVEARMGGRQ